MSFDANGGDELSEDDSNKTVTFNTTYGPLPTPSRTGYTFVDWLTKDNEDITNKTTVNITDDCTLYAEWTANNYTIIFNTNGGEELINITVIYDGNYSCLPVPSREGYTFLWWYIEETGKRVDNDTKVEIACDHTLCAAWDKNTVIFDVNGGDELGENEKEKEVTYESKYETLPTPSRNGYTFDGWFDKNGEEITSETKVEIVSDQTFYAKWTANNYTMKLDVNGGNELDEGENSINVTYDGTYGYLPTPTKTGYTFIGWYTEKNEYVTSETIVKDACGCTLHANWTANTYVIVLNVNGGDELSEDKRNITVTYDGNYDSLPTPTREGYEFAGWFNEDGEEITGETKVIIAKNQVLHAEWTKIVASTSQTVTPTKYVEIVFGKGDMNEKDVKEILVKFTNEDFDIMEIDDRKSGETTVIIKFNDVEDAEEFLTAFNESSDSTKGFIRYASFNSRFDESFSIMVYPFMLFNTMFI